MIPKENMLDEVDLKDLSPLTSVLEILQRRHSKGMKAIEISAYLKRAEKFVADVRSALLYDANKEFTDMRLNEPKKKTWTFLNDTAEVTSFKPKSTWTYTPALTKKYADIQNDMKREQISGSATKTEAEVDPVKSSLFAIAIKVKK